MAASICVVGVGGAGGRMVGNAGAYLARGIHVAAINTDARELDQATVPMKLQIGMTRTGGLGTGGIPGTARLAVEDDISTVRELLAERDLVVVVAGLGGGTGSGAAPAVLRAASDAGAATVALVTLPFAFEGGPRAQVAQEALRAVREAADSLVVIDDARLLEAVGETRVADAFERADEILGRSVATLCNLITQPGYIKLDLADLRQLARQSGDTCSLGYAEARGPERARDAAQALLTGPMLEGGRLVTAAGALLVGIVGGPDLTLQEVGTVMDAVAARRGPECRTFMGTHIDVQSEGVVRLVLLVSELWEPEAPARAVAEAPAVAKAGRRASRVRASKSTQPTLALTMSGRGRFRNVEPTILDGEDLDVPTFIRRGIRIEA